MSVKLLFFGTAKVTFFLFTTVFFKKKVLSAASALKTAIYVCQMGIKKFLPSTLRFLSVHFKGHRYLIIATNGFAHVLAWRPLRHGHDTANGFLIAFRE